MEWITQVFRANPVIPVFLSIGLGFWIGRFRYRSFSLGPVAGTLLVGVALGQLNITIAPSARTIFFMLFLFSIGYSVGPQFFHSFRGGGLKEVIFALIMAIICASTVLLVAKVMGYGKGISVGMFSGSLTISAVLGVATETIRGMDLTSMEKTALLDMLPACYAVTYIFGTVGTIWFLSNIAPRMLGGLEKVRAETACEEAELDTGEFEPEPGFIAAGRPVSFRAFRAEGDFFLSSRTVGEIEASFMARGLRIFVERLRIKGELRDPSPDLKVSAGDIMVLSARREVMIEEAPHIGPEVADEDLLNFGVEEVPVTISRTGVAGMTLGALRSSSWMRGVLVKNITRNNVCLPLRSKVKLQGGDVISLVGLAQDVDSAVQKIGYSDRRTNETDMVFLGLGIAAGCFAGVLSFTYHGVPLSLSACGGALLAGLVLGWARTNRPTFGRIPVPVIWILENLGLNMFIAVVGITSGAGFISALEEVGIGLFFAGIVCTLVPLFAGVLIGKKFFHFTSAQTLGCVAGARAAGAALGSVVNTIGSNLPAVGYSVTYAVANIALVFSSLIVLALV